MKNDFDLILRNAYFIDGKGNTPISNMDIGIRDRRIVYLGKIDILQDNMKASEIIDLTGLTVLPGFINAHAHTGFKYVNGVEFNDFQREYLKGCIYEGVTTVRDEGMLSDFSIEEMLKTKAGMEKEAIYPRIITTGKFFSAPGGYGGKAPIAVDSIHEVSKMVNEAVDKGIDIIKTVLEDGMDPSTFGLPKLPDELLKSICREAHTRGKKVSAHVTQVHNLYRLVKAGIDDAAHMVYDYLPDELLQDMIIKGIHIVPTLTVLKYIQDKYNAPLLETGKQNVKRFVEAGGKIAVGDDFMEAEAPWYRNGMPYMELQLLEEAGLTPMQIIAAATQNGAEVCNILNETGTLELNKLADILIIEGNPLEDINNIRKVKMVLKEGVIARQ